jgi:hypothetical protein
VYLARATYSIISRVVSARFFILMIVGRASDIGFRCQFCPALFRAKARVSAKGILADMVEVG